MGEKENNHLYFIDRLRAAGMFLVAWPHLTANLAPSWKPLAAVQWLINRPLAVIQNFGALGVCLFFLIGGFLACEPSARAPRAPWYYFLYKLAGILIPIWGEMLGFFLVTKAGELIGLRCYWSQFSVTEWIKSAALINLLAGTGEPVNGVLWFILPYLIFVLFNSLYRFYSREPSLTFCISCEAILGVCYVLSGVLPEQLCANLIYIPIMLAGYLVNIGRRKKNGAVFFLTCAGCYLLTVAGFYRFAPNFFEAEPYMVSIAFALFIFLICMKGGTGKRPSKPVMFFSDISFSFYIVHSLYGGLLISALYEHVPYGLCLLSGAAISVLAAYVNTRWIERPVKKGLVRLAGRVNKINE